MKPIKLTVNHVEADEDFPKNIPAAKVNEKTPIVKQLIFSIISNKKRIFHQPPNFEKEIEKSPKITDFLTPESKSQKDTENVMEKEAKLPLIPEINNSGSPNFERKSSTNEISEPLQKINIQEQNVGHGKVFSNSFVI